MYLSPLIFSTLIIGSIALAVAAVIFLILYVREWNQRIKEEHEHDKEMAKIITEYEFRMVSTEKGVQHNSDFIEMLIQKSPLITQEIKQSLISDFKSGKGKIKMPYEVKEEA